MDAGQRLPVAASTSPQTSEPASSGPALTGRRRQDVPEEILWEGRYSPKGALGPGVGCVLASMALVVIAALLGRESIAWIFTFVVVGALWILLLAWLARKRLGIHYKLTNQMFYHQRGILTRTTDRVEVIDIDDITYTQGLFERLAKVGRIEILSSDRTNPKFCVEGVENVEEVAKTMDRARRAERIRRGVSVESLTPGVSGN
jgi:membrane protein YdbS with pleckstrin-like domain